MAKKGKGKSNKKGSARGTGRGDRFRQFRPTNAKYWNKKLRQQMGEVVEAGGALLSGINQLKVESSITPPSPCPGCSTVLSGATIITVLQKAVPEPGDFSVCGYCYQVLRYNKLLAVEAVGESELERLILQDFRVHEQMGEALMIAREVNRKLGREPLKRKYFK